MKSTKIRISLVVCILALLLTLEGRFICTALAAGKTTPWPGYAEFRDGDNDKIISDGELYMDSNLEGEDSVTLTIENRSQELFRSDITLGSTKYNSPRRVLMDLSDPVSLVQQGTTTGIMLDILYESDGTPRTNNPEDPIVHFQVAISIPGSKPLLTYVAFIADVATREELINQGAEENDLEKFKFSGGDTPGDYSDDYLIYRLSYEGCAVTEGSDGRTWEIQPYGGPVRLFVYKIKNRKSGSADPLYLAEYEVMPFAYTTWYNPSNPAPQMHRNLSALWGRIKEQ